MVRSDFLPILSLFTTIFLSLIRIGKIMTKLAVVTGANKGIGFETALKLAAACVKVILACRTEVLGQEAADKLKALGYDVEYRNLDISDSASIESFVKSTKNDYSKLDILVNNAAIAIAEGSDIPAKEHAFRTVNCNVFGTIKLTEALLPLLRNADAPRIVNVASQLGHLKTLTSTSLRTRFANVASVTEVEALMREFIQAYEDGTYIEKGWTHTEYTAYSVYSVSKVGLLAWNAVLARDELAHGSRKNFLINAVCPGHCSTDLNNHTGPRTPEHGARTPALLALWQADEPTQPTGKFFADDVEIEW